MKNSCLHRSGWVNPLAACTVFNKEAWRPVCCIHLTDRQTPARVRTVQPNTTYSYDPEVGQFLSRLMQHSAYETLCWPEKVRYFLPFQGHALRIS